jgi:hypothetical protein
MATDDNVKQLGQRRLLGWGVACQPIYPGVDLGRDISLAGGDLATVSGFVNLSQDLAVALTSALGADPFNTGFGFDGVNALAEESNPLLVRERIRVSIIKLLKNDPRVRRILDVKLLDGRLDPLASNSPSGLDTATQRSLNVRVAFETVTGDQSSLDLGGVKINV